VSRPGGWDGDEDGAIPFVLVGVVALGGTLGAAWAGHGWSQRLLGEAGGELTVWVLRGAFWALDLVALQASMEPVDADWYTPVLEGPALPLYALAALVMVGTLLAETITGMVQGNTPRIVQAVFRALVAGMLATVGASLLLAVGGGLSEIGRIALHASGTSVDAPLIPLQEVLMDTAEQRADGGVELFIAFLAGLVIVLTSLSIYFLLAMRPVVLAAIIVFLPIAHAVSVWTPMRRVQLRIWSLAFAVLLADAAILTMFAVANTAMGQPEGVDRLIFGTFGLLLAALSPAALARIVGAPELHSAVQTMSRGSKALAIGAGLAAVKGGQRSLGHAVAAGGRPGGSGGRSALEAAGPTPGGGSPSGGPAGGSGPSGGGAPGAPSGLGGAGAAGTASAGGGGAPGSSSSPAGAASTNGRRTSASASAPTSAAAGRAPGPATTAAGAACPAGGSGSVPAEPAASSAESPASGVGTNGQPAASSPAIHVRASNVRGSAVRPTVEGTPRTERDRAAAAPAGRSGWSSALAEAGRR
jgi:hypothetical protein